MKSVARAKELNKLLVECNFPSICIHSAQKQDERYVPPLAHLVRSRSMLTRSDDWRFHSLYQQFMGQIHAAVGTACTGLYKGAGPLKKHMLQALWMCMVKLQMGFELDI